MGNRFTNHLLRKGEKTGKETEFLVTSLELLDQSPSEEQRDPAVPVNTLVCLSWISATCHTNYPQADVRLHSSNKPKIGQNTVEKKLGQTCKRLETK